MVFKRAGFFALAFMVAAAPAQAQDNPVDQIFEEWLTAFNSGDKALIQAFHAEFLDDPEAAFALDTAKATCGFDPVRVESRTARGMNVLLAERCFPALQRLHIELSATGESKLARFDLRPLALPLESANKAVVDLANRLAADDDFAGSLLIATNDEVLVAHSLGTLGADEDAPITLDTPMFIASAGKMFTAVSVLQLVEDGRIDLDAPISTYLTDYPNAEMAKATIRQLLRHQGGAGDIGILARNDDANRARVRTIADLVALNGDRPPGFAPGTRTEYSNYGFVLLGAIVERVTGRSYYDYVADEVFAPADMTSAGFPDLEHLQGVATGSTTFYGEEDERVSNVEILPWRGSPAGGGVASANDMLKFFAALRSGTLLSPAMFKLATSSAGETPWGMGFLAVSNPYSSWGHGGNSYGMDVAAHFYADVDTAFICLSTRDMACNRLIFPWFLKVYGLTE